MLSVVKAAIVPGSFSWLNAIVKSIGDTENPLPREIRKKNGNDTEQPQAIHPLDTSYSCPEFLLVLKMLDPKS